MVLLQPKYIKKFKAEKEKYQDHEKRHQIIKQEYVRFMMLAKWSN